MYNISLETNSGFLIVATTSNWDFLAGDVRIFTIEDLENIEKIQNFEYQQSGNTQWRTFDVTYRISSQSVPLTAWLPLSKEPQNFPPSNPLEPTTVEVKFERVGESTSYNLALKGFSIKFAVTRNILAQGGVAHLNPQNSSQIIKPKDIYKVFKLEHFETITSGDTDNLSIKWRWSQDYGRSVSRWEPLTRENIKSAKINPIRFFQVEYLLEYSGTDSVNLYDINLLGDFQNVTLDAQKTNLLSLREDCTCIKLELVGGVSASQEQLQTEMLNKTCSSSGLYRMDQKDIDRLYKPYQLNPLVEFWNKLANDTNQVFGHEIYYFLTDPDKKGIDYTFGEYQLYNYVCDGLLKVSVEGNKFPEDNMTINQFDLSLFDSFEIHILKEDFKKIFGVEKRPGKEDFLWFCEINKMFIVEHAREQRQLNNASVYWKVMLKKYSQSASLQPVNQQIKDKLDRLTKNSTIEELFGKELEDDKRSTANKPELKTLSQEKIRLDVKSPIEREIIHNSTFVISKSHYQMNRLTPGTEAVVYHNMQNTFTKGDNFSFFAWFSINLIPVVKTNFNLLHYWDGSQNQGIKININQTSSDVVISGLTYSLPVSGLLNDTWYCFLVNVDQRIGTIEQFLYKRVGQTEQENSRISSIELNLLFSNSLTLTRKFIEIEDTRAKILASNMKLTNIRLFSDIIPKEKHSEILSLSKIGNDSKYLIFADNANQRITTLEYLPFQ